MKKLIFIILAVVIIMILWWGYGFKKPELKGFYQKEVNGYHVQILIRREDNSFVEWIDNREVDRGTYEKINTNLYRIKSNKQSF